MNLENGVDEERFSASFERLPKRANSRELEEPAALVHSYFKREVGSVARAQLHFGEYSNLPKPTSLAAKNGVRYEKKVLSHLSRQFGNRLLAGPLFTFDGKRCFPDALLFSKDWKALCILEVKFRHTGDAWWQLNRFYAPIVRAALPMFEVFTAEATANYDPSQKLPSPVAFLDNLEQSFETRETFHCLHVLSERELRYDRDLV